MSKQFVTPAKYARIRQAAAAFILDGAGVVPNRMAEFEEPIYAVANTWFDFKTILAKVDHEFEKHGLDPDGPFNEAIVHAYDTTLIVGYMFGVAVGLQMAGGLASVPKTGKGRMR